MKTRDIVVTGMLAALCVIATFIKIPFGAGAMINLGSAFIFTAAGIFGGLYTGLAAAIGSALYDLLMGFSPYTLWTFFIKGIAGLLAGYLAVGLYPHNKPYNFGRHLLAIMLAAIWTLGGYLLAWWQVIGSFSVALANAPASLLTSFVGMIVALLLTPLLRKALAGMLNRKNY